MAFETQFIMLDILYLIMAFSSKCAGTLPQTHTGSSIPCIILILGYDAHKFSITVIPFNYYYFRVWHNLVLFNITQDQSWSWIKPNGVKRWNNNNRMI